MAVIFRFLGKEYSYKIVDGEVQNYVIYDGLYPELCESKEEEESLEAFFEYLNTTANAKIQE